ncbi:MAG: hypothetical protein R6U57_05250 [Anaerolineales bacterium]
MENLRFGYGIRVSLNEETMGTEVACAERFAFDWIAVELDWDQFWLSPSDAPRYQSMDRLMSHARDHDMQVMISIGHAPDWAQTRRGPSAKYTSQLVAMLLERYPSNIGAFELYPGANTYEGWGRDPDPAKYTALLNGTQRVIDRAGRDVSLVAGGFVPSPLAHKTDMRDTDFLQALYRYGMREDDPIIGVRLPRTTGRPGDGPMIVEGDVIRHYEQIRQVMLENDHRHGLIWMTSFSLPDSLQTELEGQEGRSRWLQEAYLRLRSQLFIEVAFYEPQPVPSFEGVSLSDPLPGFEGDQNYIQKAMEAVAPGIGEFRGEISGGSPSGPGIKKLTQKTLVKYPPP